MTTTKTGKIVLYTVRQAIWGRDYPETKFFESIADRDAYLANHDYCDRSGRISVTPEEYDNYKKYGFFQPF